MSHVIGLVLSHLKQDVALVQGELPRIAGERAYDGSEFDKLMDVHVELLTQRSVLAERLRASLQALHREAPQPETSSNVVAFANRARTAV
jgi:hypothetical protein